MQPRVYLDLSVPRQGNSTLSASITHLQRFDERRLGDVDLAELAHALFALFLLFEQLDTGARRGRRYLPPCGGEGFSRP
jgi:hypothetical protein